jgi:cytidine deaminase
MKKTTFKNLNPTQQQLVLEAAKAMEKAYNPYSHFFVGAAIMTPDKKIITGANVENAAYGSCICAERSALVRANAEGIRKISHIAVIGRPGKKVCPDPVAPCGACRQMIFESSQISKIDTEIIMANTKMDKIIIARISELLPLAFGPKDLK